MPSSGSVQTWLAVNYNLEGAVRSILSPRTCCAMQCDTHHPIFCTSRIARSGCILAIATAPRLNASNRRAYVRTHAQHMCSRDIALVRP